VQRLRDIDGGSDCHDTLCHKRHESVRLMWGKMASCAAVGSRRRQCILRTPAKWIRHGRRRPPTSPITRHCGHVEAVPSGAAPDSPNSTGDVWNRFRVGSKKGFSESAEAWRRTCGGEHRLRRPPFDHDPGPRSCHRRGERIRPISARSATQHERRNYEETSLQARHP
jgi:hypothetical protein